MKFSNKDGAAIVPGLIKIIQENREYLSEIDGKIGDGDHGINMNKGFSMCADRLATREYTMSEGLLTLSETLMDDIGGSMGPLYGVFFESLAAEADSKEYIDSDVFFNMLNNGLAGVQDIGSAKVGDKTLIDTLYPAVKAFENAKNSGKDFRDCLSEMQVAAKNGWQSTEFMVAKIGRASRLGERSRGVLDAGATSCYLLLDAFAETIKSLL